MFHLGALRALRAEADFNLVDAQRVIATSAGAGVAAAVLTGTSLEDTGDILMSPPSGEERSFFV